MKCSICHQYIYRKITIKNIFYKDVRQTCQYCFMRYMNYYPYFVIPVNGGLLHIFELLKEDLTDYSLFIQYLYPYYKAYLKTSKMIDAIYIDTLDHEFIDLIDKLNLGNLIIFTNKFKEE